MKTMIKDSNGKFVGTTEIQGNRIVVKEFGSGKIVSTYNPKTDTTLSFEDNRTTHGDVAITKLNKY